MRRKRFHRKRGYRRHVEGERPRGYGVLKGQVRGTRREDRGSSPHYHILLVGDRSYRVAINVQSAAQPPDLLCRLDPDFRAPLTAGLTMLPPGFHRLPPQPGGQALDYVRGNLFDPADLIILPATLPGPHNDLSDALDEYLARAAQDPAAWVYAFGMLWGPERRADRVFHFRPAVGLHNVHMNQGNAPGHIGEDGVWQDGGLLIHFPDEDRWVGLFLAFQSQCWQTDDRTGHSTPPHTQVS